jgi:hypothetical protein
MEADQHLFKTHFSRLETPETSTCPNLLAMVLHQSHYTNALVNNENPMIGTLVDVCSIRTLRDGSLLAQGVGLCRITVLHSTVSISPDEEELSVHALLAGGEVMREVRRCESLSQDVLAVVHNGFFRSAAVLVARAAAAAAALAAAPRDSRTIRHILAPEPSARGPELLAASVSAPEVAETDAARVAARRAAAPSLRAVGYRPMMSEGEAPAEGGSIGETIPPSWMEALSHHGRRMADEAAAAGADDGRSARTTDGDATVAAEPSPGPTDPLVAVDPAVGGWLGDEGPAGWAEGLAPLERRVWAAADALATLAGQLRRPGDGMAGDEDWQAAAAAAGAPSAVRAAERLGLRGPGDVAGGDWRAVRRAQLLSYVLAGALTGGGRGAAPERERAAGLELLRAPSVRARLLFLAERMERRAARLRAELALRDAVV